MAEQVSVTFAVLPESSRYALSIETQGPEGLLPFDDNLLVISVDPLTGARSLYGVAKLVDFTSLAVGSPYPGQQLCRVSSWTVGFPNLEELEASKKLMTAQIDMLAQDIRRYRFE